MNGSSMKKFEAPTYRMISVSSLRDMADSRIVVGMSSRAVSTMIAASTTETFMNLLRMLSRDSRFSLWSLTTSTPLRPLRVSVTTL